MISVVKSQGATIANGALTLYVFNVNYNGTLQGATSTDGFLTDADSASFVILDSAGTQVYPPSGHQSLNVIDAPPTGNRLSAGRYAAVWTPDSGLTIGQYTVRWFFVRNGAPEDTFDQEFELVPKAYAGRNYCTLYDLRAEGLTTTLMSDTAAQVAIVRASAYAEHFTGRRFLPEYKEAIDIDGTGGRAVLLDEPIIAIQEIKLNFVTNFVAQDLLIPGQTLKCYNRHITKNLLTPDDRENPKVEFVHGADLTGVNYYESGTGYVLYQLMFPMGRQNVRFAGVFGYTEFDGSVNSPGSTPLMLREAVKMLVFKNRALMINRPLSSVGPAGPMIEEHTRDQGASFQASWLKGAFTGNPEIDQLLAAFVRSPKFGAA